MGGRYWVWLGVRLGVAVAIVLWAASYMGPGSGEKEFKKTLDAMKEVHSFRMSVSATPLTQHNDTLWEVDCNHNLVHRQEHHVDTCTDPPECTRQTDMSWEELDFAVYKYVRKPDGSWAGSGHLTGNQTRYGCGHLAEGTDSNLMPPIATMIARGILQKGDKKTVNGVPCREWLVTMKGGPGGLEHDTLCLGLQDNLPYEMTVDWSHSRASFSDYNTAIEFDLPADVARAISANGSN
jgi:hypothetical protein